MNTRYSRNRIYLEKKDQEIIKKYKILLGGGGIGSVIAECALRLGFENFTIIDGDQVELSNLNRQNYTEGDISKNKVDAIKDRLLAINSKANIVVHDCFLTADNIESFIKEEDNVIAINALDFSSDIPLLFDEICQKYNIPVLHPYNLGWAGLVAVISPTSLNLKSIAKKDEEFNEVAMVQYASNYMKFWNSPYQWIDDIIEKYKKEEEQLSAPQLSIASWTVAGMCANILFNIATKKKVKKFPKFYLSTIME